MPCLGIFKRIVLTHTALQEAIDAAESDSDIDLPPQNGLPPAVEAIAAASAANDAGTMLDDSSESDSDGSIDNVCDFVEDAALEG